MLLTTPYIVFWSNAGLENLIGSADQILVKICLAGPSTCQSGDVTNDARGFGALKPGHQSPAKLSMLGEVERVSCRELSCTWIKLDWSPFMLANGERGHFCLLLKCMGLPQRGVLGKRNTSLSQCCFWKHVQWKQAAPFPFKHGSRVGTFAVILDVLINWPICLHAVFNHDRELLALKRVMDLITWFIWALRGKCRFAEAITTF